MSIPREAADRLDAQLDRLRRDHLVVLELDDLRHLLVEPDGDPFAPGYTGAGTGIDDIAATLCAARTLPDELTVRVVVPTVTSTTGTVLDIRPAFRRHAEQRATVAWREAMTVRNLGRRQLPLGLTISVISAALAYAAGALATDVESDLTVGILVVVAGLLITVAWVVSWMVIETVFVDWRPAGRQAAAYDLLARASLEIDDLGDGSPPLD